MRTSSPRAWCAAKAAGRRSPFHHSPPAQRNPLGISRRAGSYQFRKLGRTRSGEVAQELIGRKLAHILCGGDTTTNVAVGEAHILDLEREAFLSLCGEPSTLARIRHTLETGKPLRN